MTMKQEMQKKLKDELESITHEELTDKDSYEAYFNLSNFLITLRKMKKEATNGSLQN